MTAAPGSPEAAASGYMREAAIQDELLDTKLTKIRQQEDTGAISMRQAADQRVMAMEHHLQATMALRAAWFGSGAALSPAFPSWRGDGEDERITRARTLLAEHHQPIAMSPGDVRHLLARFQRAAVELLAVVDGDQR